MKRLYCLLALTVALFSSHSNAISVFDAITSLREPLSNALVAATESNDKRAINGVNKALRLVDQASVTNLSANLGLLSRIGAAVLRTSASNEVGVSLQASIDAYIDLFNAAANSQSNRLAGTFPSGVRTAAQRNLGQLAALVASADSATDLKIGLKALTKSLAKLRVVSALVTRAEAVPPPPDNVTATVEISGSPLIKGFTFKSKGAGITPGATGNFDILAGTKVGTGVHSELQSVFFGLGGLVPGVNANVPLYNGGCSATGGARHLEFSGGTGIAQVTWSTNKEVLFGTFSFTAKDQDQSHTATITGSFSGTY